MTTTATTTTDIAIIAVLTPAMIGPTIVQTVQLDTPAVTLDELRDLAPEIQTFDVVEGARGVSIWCDDEGLLSHWPVVNLAASALAGQRIVGRAIIAGLRPDDGATIGLDTAQLAAVRAASKVHRGRHFTG